MAELTDKCLSEYTIHLFSENLLKGNERDIVEKHIKNCAKCSTAYYTSNKLSAIIRDGVVKKYDSDSIVSDIELADIVQNSIRRNRNFSQMVSFTIAAALIIALGAILLNRKDAILPDQNRYASESSSSYGDSISFEDDGYLIKTAKNSVIMVEKRELGTIKIQLLRGELMVAADKCLYDTILITAGNMRVYTTGTRFVVGIIADSSIVSVLDGEIKVSILSSPDAEIKVSAMNSAILAENRNRITIHPLSNSERMNLEKSFGAISHTYDDPVYDSSSRDDSVLDTVDPNVTAKKHFTMISKLMQNGEYDKAVLSIKDYIFQHNRQRDSVWFNLAVCYTNTKDYNKAKMAYKRAITETNSDFLKEKAMHRLNRLLYVNLKDYDAAKKEIETYISLYPDGQWIKYERRYLAKILATQQQKLN